MAESFGEVITPASSIKQILGSYPFSVGLFRELLQNSDDARATVQVLVLDKRSHEAQTLLHPFLAQCQGPALLAFNDGKFGPQDWKAIREINISSKKTDTSKIGKYGLGFRSCYHITDHPHIWSTDALVVFDPEHKFTDQGGLRISLHDGSLDLSDQLAAFSSCVAPNTKDLDGTVFRLPLRIEETLDGLGPPVSPDMVHQLMRDFEDELRVVLLFLKHVSSVELRVVDDHGTQIVASARVQRGDSQLQPTEPRLRTAPCMVETTSANSTLIRSWLLFDYAADVQDVTAAVSTRLGSDARSVLQVQKLAPDMSLAFCLEESVDGQLFTYLPLPIRTSFPSHIHGLFALTPDRQHLSNADETGLPDRSHHKIKVTWNRVLFEHVLPKAWASALEFMSRHHPTVDIFTMWPPKQHAKAKGDLGYWAGLPAALVHAAENMPIWPLVRISDQLRTTLHVGTAGQKVSTPHHASLQDVLMAVLGDTDDINAILTVVGVSVVQAPRDIYEMVANAAKTMQPLTPRNVWSVLTRNQSALHTLSQDALYALLTYLVSDGSIQNVSDLPLFSTRTSTSVVVSRAGNGSKRMLLSQTDTLFSEIDGDAILIAGLPPGVSKLLLSQGPRHLNISVLGRQDVINYLRKISNRSSSLSAPADADWILRFWNWLPGSSMGPQILSDSAFNELRIIPCQGVAGSLRAADKVFARNANEELTSALLQLAFKVVVLDFPIHASKTLLQHGKLFSMSSLEALLSSFPRSSRVSLDQNLCDVLRRYVVSLMLTTTVNQRLAPSLRANVRHLPIFETVDPAQRASGYANVPSNYSIVVVPESAHLLPVVQQTSFVKALETVLVRNMDGPFEAQGKLLTKAELAQFSIRHLADQTPAFQLEFLSEMKNVQASMPRNVLQDLAQATFVRTSAGDLRAPAELLDPRCDIAASLYDHGSNILPSTADYVQKKIVDALRQLDLLQSKMTVNILRDCIQRISNGPQPIQARYKKACALLALISQHRYDCRNVTFDLTAAWLPTEAQTLSAPADSYDSYIHNRALFDRVAPAFAVEIPSSLRKVLRLEVPIPSKVIIAQFAHVLGTSGHERYERSLNILEELGAREVRGELSNSLISELKEVTTGHLWIPIKPKVSVDAAHAAFELPFAESSGLPLYAVPSMLASKPGVHSLLTRLGCCAQPSAEVLLACMTDLPAHLDTRTLRQCVSLLEALLSYELTNEQTSQLRIPDRSGTLQSPNQVWFNDIQHRVTELELPSDMFPAHPRITEDLARAFHLAFLSELSLGALIDEDSDEDMEEMLTTRISSVLRQYTEDRALLEFVANAVDAGAYNFTIIVDEATHRSRGDFLTSRMAELQGPALVIFNDAIFKDKDWRGIRRVGLGGKIDDPDSIGRFGLGALSVYHFTDVAMIVSNQHVMFIDPSREHLTTRKHRATRKISLKKARLHYRHHLEPLDGLCGFDLSMDTYSGTLFRLPLRTMDQALHSPLSQVYRSISDMTRLVQVTFQRLAEDCMFFTPICSVRAYRRTPFAKRLDLLWNLLATRKVLEDNPESRRTALQITFSSTEDNDDVDLPGGFHHDKPSAQEWLVSEMFRIECPSDLRELEHRHQLPVHLKVGVAARQTPPSQIKPVRHRLFSHMPLPIQFELPFHVNGSFILADDRRTIRFDDSGMRNPESRLNRWLLTDALPLAIYGLLGALPVKDVFAWWPRPVKDPIAVPVVEGFLARLNDCDDSICADLQGQGIVPSKATFLPSEPRAAMKVFRSVLRPSGVVHLPSALRASVLATDVHQLDAVHARSLLFPVGDLIRDAYRRQQITLGDIQDLLDFLGPKLLPDLDLLVLADNSITRFGATEHKIYITRTALLIHPWSLFPANRFLHPELSMRSCLSETALRLAVLDGAAIAQLVRDRIPEGTSRDLSTADAAWAKDLWAITPLLPEQPGDSVDLSQMPLVPTTEGQKHVSLQSCLARNSGMLVAPSRDDAWIRLIMEQLGATCFQIDAFPHQLREQFAHRQFGVDVVLAYLRSRSSTVPGQHLFGALSQATHKRFAEWIVYQLELKTKQELANISGADSLPIWKARQGAQDNTLCAISDMEMLPEGIRLADVQGFLSHSVTITPYAEVLHRLGMQPISFYRLRNILDIPSTITGSLMPMYKRLLRLIVEHRSKDGRAPPVPNRAGVIVSASTLYTRSQPLFEAAFASEPNRFIHPQLEDMQDELAVFGLETRLNFATFKACVEAIARGVEGPGHVLRANTVFDFYSTRLPMLVAGNRWQWRELDEIAFIPASQQRRRNTIWSADYAQPMPINALRSPSQMLRAEHQGIAWTQRALFLNEPSQNLKVADLELGVPSVEEVVSHLGELALRIGPARSGDADVLSDIQQTYAWLSTKVSEAGPLLRARDQQKLWLNVDDPTTEEWQWHSASQLLFDFDDAGEWREVREHLLPFQALLIAVGAQKVDRPARPVVALTPAEKHLDRMRLVADSLRVDRKLTDVVLVAKDGQEFHAHRLFLVMASDSDYMRDAFLNPGRFAESSTDTSTNNPSRLLVDHSAAAVGACLNFIYLGVFPDELEMEELVDVMKLAHYWSMIDLFYKTQELLVVTYVSPHTYAYLSDEGSPLHAQLLLDGCQHIATELAKKPVKLPV